MKASSAERVWTRKCEEDSAARNQQTEAVGKKAGRPRELEQAAFGRNEPERN